jgi:RHS repeat-associated protein
VELDETGRIISYEEYYPYGSTSYQAMEARIKTAAKRYRYTGKERDEETGLFYHGARYYACWLGRWISVDPGGLVDGVNRYAYVGNKPTHLVDSSGMAGEDPWDQSVPLDINDPSLDDPRRQLTFAQAPAYDKTVTATYSDRGITQSHRDANRGIWLVWGGDPNAEIVVAHRGKPFGLLPAGETSITYIEHEEFNQRRSSQEKQWVDESRANGEFTRNGRNDPTAKKGVQYPQVEESTARQRLDSLGRDYETIGKEGLPQPSPRPQLDWPPPSNPDQLNMFPSKAAEDRAAAVIKSIDDMVGTAPSSGVISDLAEVAGKGAKRLAPGASLGLGLASAKANAAEGAYVSAGLDLFGLVPGIGDLADFGRTLIEGALVLAEPREDPDGVAKELAVLIMKDEDPASYENYKAGLMEWNGNRWIIANGPERP